MTSNGELKTKCSDQLNFEPARTVLRLAKESNLEITDEAFATFLDERDELKNLRQEFYYPKTKDLPLGKLELAINLFKLCRKVTGLLRQ